MWYLDQFNLHKLFTSTVSRLTSCLIDTESTVDKNNFITLAIFLHNFLHNHKDHIRCACWKHVFTRASTCSATCTLLQTSEVSFITRAAVHQPPVCRACEPTLLPESRQIFGINVFKHKSHFILHIYGYIFTTLSLWELK